MEFDRYRVKTAARAILHDAQPRPWRIALIYRLLALILPLLMGVCLPLFILLAAMPAQPYAQEVYPPPALSAVFPLVFLIVWAVTALFRAGYFQYCLKLWRGEAGCLRDLFHGFRHGSSFLPLLGLLLLFTILWIIPGFLVLGGILAFLLRFLPEVAQLPLCSLALELAYLAYLLNRLSRYALALPLLVDHPQYTAWQALAKSKRLMTGRRWELFVLHLSFLGWKVLAFFLAYFVGGFLFLLPSVLLFSRSEAFVQPLSPMAALLLILSLLTAMLLVSAPMTL